MQPQMHVPATAAVTVNLAIGPNNRSRFAEVMGGSLWIFTSPQGPDGFQRFCVPLRNIQCYLVRPCNITFQGQRFDWEFTVAMPMGAINIIFQDQDRGAAEQLIEQLSKAIGDVNL